MGVVVVQQPLQAQAQAPVARQIDDRVGHETGDQPPCPDLRFPAELQQGAAGAVVAEPAQAQGALQGHVRLTANQSGEQRFQVRFGRGRAGGGCRAFDRRPERP
ncbi:MAG: hypothetical protein V9G98_17850 [Candidatus Competibacter sp.]